MAGVREVRRVHRNYRLDNSHVAKRVHKQAFPRYCSLPRYSLCTYNMYGTSTLVCFSFLFSVHVRDGKTRTGRKNSSSVVITCFSSHVTCHVHPLVEDHVRGMIELLISFQRSNVFRAAVAVGVILLSRSNTVVLSRCLCLQVSALKLAPTGTRGPLACLFGVFDGHGGDGASKFVANHLHHLVCCS